MDTMRKVAMVEVIKVVDMEEVTRAVVTEEDRMNTALVDNRAAMVVNNKVTMALDASNSRPMVEQETTILAAVGDMEVTTTLAEQLNMPNSTQEILGIPTCSPTLSTISARISKTLEISRLTSKKLFNPTSNFLEVVVVAQARLQAPAPWALRLQCRP